MLKNMTIKRLKEYLYKWAHAPEYVYLITALIGVISFALITPPFQGPDEEAHYVRVQYIAHGYVIPVYVDDSNASLPQSLQKILKITFYTDDLRGKTADKYELARTKEALNIPGDASATYKPPMINYSALPYAPAIPGVAISNLLNLSPLISMYIARVFLGVASVIIMFFAIKLIPRKKYLFAAVGLIPMLLFQQAMVAIDGVSYALLALFIAYVLYLNEKVTIRKKQWLFLGLLCIALVLAKPLIWLFIPFIFLLAKRKQALIWIAGIAVACVIAFAALTLASNIKSQPDAGSTLPDNVNSTSQLEMLLSNPKRGLRVAWNSYMTTYGDEETRGVIGVFGAADTLLPVWMYSLSVIVLGLLCVLKLDDKRTKEITRGWKIFTITLLLAYFGAVNLAIYLSYTPVNFDIIYGVQGRYLLPMIIVAAALIFTGGIVVGKKDASKVKLYVAVATLSLVLLSLLIVLQRYYLYTP